MEFTFTRALQTLGRGAAFELANQARPGNEYLLNTLLPEQNSTEYFVESGTMTVRTTMAGLVGMDSPYPPGGFVEQSTFTEQTAKIAIENYLPEAALRRIQGLLTQLQLRGGAGGNETLATEALNFLQKVIIQAMMDTTEWLRAQALVTGAIDWTFNGKRLQVNYGVPAGNLVANRTGTAGYGGTASVFWTDWRNARRLLRHNMRAAICNSNTADMILYNAANGVEVLNQTVNIVTFRRYANAANGVPSTDARDTAQLIIYDGEGEVFNPAAPTVTTIKKFIPDGKILFVANNQRNGYRVGEGSTPNPLADNALGFTHLGPTVEGDGRPGRWADMFTPENQPWQLRARGASNVLPVIEKADGIVVLSTDMS